MPDNDRIPRGVRPAWFRTVELALAGGATAEVGDELRRAVAAELRREEVPPTAPLVRALHDSAFFGDPDLWETAARAYGRRGAGRDLVHRLHQEGSALLERRAGELAGAGEQELAQALGEGALRRWAAAGAFGAESAQALLVSDRFASAEQARRYIAECLDHASLSEYASLLHQRPGATIRAPSVGSHTVGTDGLMDEDLDA